MSRGLGRVQREVLALLADHWHPDPNRGWVRTYVLTGPDATRTRRESVQRALRSLTELGLIEYRGRGGGRSRGNGLGIARIVDQ